MKKTFWILSVCLASLSLAYGQDDNYYQGSGNNDAYANNDNSNNYNNNSYSGQSQYDNSNSTSQDFYNQLSPYGNWVNYGSYGYVWMPTQVDAGFSPYLTAGHWEYTDYGWTWVSDYNWGWAPFHYGRWFRDDAMGWLWMPGNEWAPAWVTWGSYGGNYCWAPLSPYYNTLSYYRPEAYYWNFVPCEHITQPYLSRYVVNRSEVYRNNYSEVCSHINIIHESNSYGHSRYFAGPRVQDVERTTGHVVNRSSVASVSTPVRSRVNGNEIQMYRPEMKQGAVHQFNAPSRQQNVSPANHMANVQQQKSTPVNNFNRNTYEQQNRFQPNTQNVQRQANPVQEQRNVNQYQARPAQRQQQLNQPVRTNNSFSEQRSFSQPVQRQQQFSQPARVNNSFSQQRSFAAAQGSSRSLGRRR